MANTFNLLASNTLSSSGASSVTFSSIPQTYNNLMLKISARSTTTAGAVTIAFNGSSSTFSGTTAYGTGYQNCAGCASPDSGKAVTVTTKIGEMAKSSDTANTFGSFEIVIPNYTSSNNKVFYVDSATTSTTNTYVAITGTTWGTTSAITSITLSGAFAQYSNFYLYGTTNA
jgi:hypothetical protein